MIDIGLTHYLFLAAIIFTIGVIGIFLNKKNVIVILMSVELILIAVNINLVSFSVFLNDIVGQVFTMFVLTVAAAEAESVLQFLWYFLETKELSMLRISIHLKVKTWLIY